MFKRADQLTKSTKENLRGGNGILHLTHILDEEQLKGMGTIFGVFTFKTGESIGEHHHIGNCEVYYVLSGCATVDDNGEMVELNAGDMTFCKDGDYHSVANNATEDLVFLAVVLNTK